MRHFGSLSVGIQMCFFGIADKVIGMRHSFLGYRRNGIRSDRGASFFYCNDRETKLFGTVGISIAAALFHNIGQLIALFLMSGSCSFVYYLSVLGISSVIMGTITGIISGVIIERMGHIGKA